MGVASGGRIAAQDDGTATPTAGAVATSPELFSDSPPILPEAEAETVAVVLVGSPSERDGVPVMIHNNTDDELYEVSIQAEVRTADDGLFAASTGSAVQPNIIAPRSFAIGLVDFGEVLLTSDLTTTFKVTAETKESDFSLADSDLRIIEAAPFADRFVGVIENPYSESLSSANVLIACFGDATDSLSVVRASYITVDVPAGDSRPFQVDFRDPLNCTTYLVAADTYI